MAYSHSSDLSNVRLHQLLIKCSCDEELVPDVSLTGNTKLHCAILGNDVDFLLQEVNESNVNEVNLKGETVLHLAAKNNTISCVLMIEKLIGAGANVDARNKWGQTPLHYAAIVESKESIDCLTNATNVDVNAKDANGYSALHCLINSNNATNPDIFDDTNNTTRPVVHEAIRILVQAGTTINAQTKYGHSILHLAAVREDNTQLLHYMLTHLPTINLNLKNKMGENFLHVYAASEIFEEIIGVFDWIGKEKNGVSRLRELLDEQNVLGRTPWNIMIDDVNASNEAVNMIMSYGVSVNVTDNLGNAVIHRIAGVSSAISYCDVLETFIKKVPDINTRNIYGESAGSVLFLGDVFKVFLKYRMNFNTIDRWKRSPLISIMKHRPIPNLIRALIVEGKSDVNIKDINGSTPLHFAAYNNYPEQIEILLEFGADINITDNLQDRPLDTVRRHGSFRCHQILQRADMANIQVHARRNEFDDFLLDVPKNIKLSEMQTAGDVQRLLRLPTNSDDFMDYLITRYFNRTPEHSDEVEAVVSEINTLVRNMCTKIAGYDSRFEMSLFPTGSTAEGTKVGRPDEFDFVLCLDKLNEITEIVVTKSCLETGYACLKFTDTPVKEEYLSFADKDGYFLAFPFLQYFFRYLRRALNEASLWKSGNLYYTFEDKIEVILGKPVFNFSAYWLGSIYKQIKISIDLVPAVYKKGWWPPNINVENIPLMNDTIKAAGCFLILQTVAHDFDRKRYKMDDSISQTCYSEEAEQNFRQKRMLRISAAPAEISLVKSLPIKFRDAYALAKIVKSKEVCPEIQIDMLPTKLYSLLSQFDMKKHAPINPSQQIKSYMLKNCTFYVLQDIHFSGPRDSTDLETTSEITARLYSYLLKFADQRFLSPYFLPHSDVFEFEKDKPRSSYKDFILRLGREVSIKLVLGILNHQFLEVCPASRF